MRLRGPTTAAAALGTNRPHSARSGGTTARQRTGRHVRRAGKVVQSRRSDADEHRCLTAAPRACTTASAVPGVASSAPRVCRVQDVSHRSRPRRPIRGSPGAKPDFPPRAWQEAGALDMERKGDAGRSEAALRRPIEPDPADARPWTRLRGAHRRPRIARRQGASIPRAAARDRLRARRRAAAAGARCGDRRRCRQARFGRTRGAQRGARASRAAAGGGQAGPGRRHGGVVSIGRDGRGP